MQGNPVGWFEIYVQDTARARKFYEAVFGIKLEKLKNTELEMWSFPSDQGKWGTSGALVKMPDFPSGRNSVIIYFMCEDCEVETGRAAKSGGKVEKKKFPIGEYGFISLVHDTEGNMIGLHSMK